MVASSVVTRSVSADMILARLQVAHPAARILLVTSPRSMNELPKFCRDLSAALEGRGNSVRRVDTAGSSATAQEPNRAGATTEGAVPRGQPAGEYTVICAPAVLDDARALLLIASADVVVVAARRGRTSRDDVVRAREEIERAGGTVAGGVLLS